MAKNNDMTCSFCGRKAEEALCMINGKDAKVRICDDCIAQMSSMIADAIPSFSNPLADSSDVGELDDVDGALNTDLSTLPKPKDINAFLDQYVIGQEAAKKFLSVAVYNHYKRVFTPQNDDEVEITKSNIVMVGPTGTGKTLLAQSIAKLLKVPFAVVDATVLTQAGYVGEDVEGILSRLYQNSDYDLESTERGIVFIDEIDKIARKGDNPSITRDVSGEGVQQAMLKLLEGTVVNVPPEGGRKHPEQKFVHINTKNILFICAGAFDGIERCIAQRMNTRVVGFDKDESQVKIDQKNLLQYVQHQDLKSYGLIPEIVGRLPILTYLDPLDAEAIKRILLEPKNAITKQYVKLFEMDGVKLTFAPEAVDLIVKHTMETKLGARGLRSVVEAIMIDAMYEIPSDERKSLKITEKYVQSQLKNRIQNVK